ncbi:hypothetical protein P691DRAFT_517383 [Macrolepiota fuliginosa MF-IS2]|uniref:Uncharacterized protein n=1 Tax=Macrolepiota fuliginosa MF-IS2 TaxID=1400762 RepID=A0A9P5X1P6_9AGAR|nr:hypothetical protein P691DRAFT_517383 [Macrolepiota fuliginosa MF-IS2]
MMDIIMLQRNHPQPSKYEAATCPGGGRTMQRHQECSSRCDQALQSIDSVEGQCPSPLRLQMSTLIV